MSSGTVATNLIVGNNLNVGGTISGNGSGLTALTAANISAGSLGAGVIASSISVNAVYPGAVTSGNYANVTGVGAQGQALNMNSHPINNVSAPTSNADAATKQYVDSFASGSTNYVQITSVENW